MASTSSAAPAQRPSLRLVPPPKPLYRDPKNHCHYSVLPFRVNQRPVARELTPADQFAENVMRQYLDRYRDGQGNFLLEREVVQGLIALGFNTGFGHAMDLEYAQAASQA